MKRLDQGHLHPKTYRTCPRCEASTLEMSNSDSLCYCYLEPLHGFPSVWHSYICKEQKLKCRITRISMQLLSLEEHFQVKHPEYQALTTCKSACLNPVGVTTMKRLDQGQTPFYTWGPETDMFRPGIEPGPPRWKASTLEKSHSNS